jgi:hypothetical protein
VVVAEVMTEAAAVVQEVFVYQFQVEHLEIIHQQNQRLH